MNALSPWFRGTPADPGLVQILHETAERTGIPASQIVSPRRSHPLVQARRAVIERAVAQGYTQSETARLLNRDATTVHEACRKMRAAR